MILHGLDKNEPRQLYLKQRRVKGMRFLIDYTPCCLALGGIGVLAHASTGHCSKAACFWLAEFRLAF